MKDGKPLTLTLVQQPSIERAEAGWMTHESETGAPHQHKRKDDPPGATTGHIRFADIGLVRNAVAAIVAIIVFGIGIGRVLARVDTAEKNSIAHADARADALKESLDDFKKEIREQLARTGSAANAATIEVGVMKSLFDQHVKEEANAKAARDLEFGQWRSTMMAIRMMYPQSRLPNPPAAAPKEKDQ